MLNAYEKQKYIPISNGILNTYLFKNVSTFIFPTDVFSFPY